MQADPGRADAVRNQRRGSPRRTDMRLLRPVAALVVGALAVLLSCLGVGTAGATPTADCDCTTSGIEEQARWADVVFTGELLASVADGDVVQHSFRVVEVYDGAAAASTDVTTRGAPDCATPLLEEGGTYVVFAQGARDGLTTTGCSGTCAATDAYVDRVRAALGDGTSPVDDAEADGGTDGVTGPGADGPAGGEDEDELLAVVAGAAAVLIVGAIGVGVWRRARGRKVATRA
ncbi:hypothetical protein [Nocardioides sp. TF02-7]|uniref:hypothetical protein n=1 Tax=Nocardioides sp. TF02-7 TaxID=2917724 RepID=UPI001F06A9D1|nr:hypothetical protein [Nocardioides sp. TF02-7]UMG91042.1 hypothetical protein MF408_12510 [Nocardioides sp. TF02-7]